MRKLLIGAGAMALLFACSSSDSDTPPAIAGTGTGGDATLGTGGGVATVTTGGATGLGTGGDTLLGTGGAIGVVTGGVPGVATGGVPGVATGGVPGVATGGVPGVATGGVIGVATGGVPMVATGGVIGVATGGVPMVATGGTVATNTGGTMVIIGNTGGTEEEDTGGTDSGADDTTADDDTPETYPDEFVVNSNGFCTQATLSGYAWTNDDDGFGEGFEDVGDAGELCASGTLELSYDSVGMIGWNIGQPSSGGTNSAVELSGSITVTYKNPGGTPLRLQIEGTDAYCIDLSGSSASEKTETFELSELVVACWEGGAQEPSYDGEGIKSIQLIAPGDEAEAREVDMCLVSVVVSMD